MRVLLALLLSVDAAAAVTRPMAQPRSRVGTPVPMLAVPQLTPTAGFTQLQSVTLTPLPKPSAPLEANASVGAPFDNAKAQLASPGGGDATPASFSAPDPLPQASFGPSRKQPSGPPSPRGPRRKWARWIGGIVLAASILVGVGVWYMRPGIDPLPQNPPAVVIGQSPYELAPALEGHKAPVVSIAEKGGKRVTVDADGQWLVTDTATGAVMRPKAYPGKARAAVFRGDTLVILDQDGTVRDGARSISPNAGAVEQHAFSAGRDTAVITNGSKLHILDLNAASSRGFQMEGRILAISAAPGEVRVATLRGAMLRLWSIKPGAAPVVAREKLVPGVTVGVTVMTPAGERVAASGGMGDSKGVLTLDWTGKLLLAGNSKFDDALVVSALAVNAAGDEVAVLGSDGRLWRWFPDDGDVEQVGTLKAGARILYGEDGKLYSSDSSGALKAW